MEDPQGIERDEAEEADAVFDAAVDDGAADVGVAADFIADDDEAEVAVTAVVFELAAGDGEGFDEARDVLLRADGAGVKQKRIANLVALEDAVALAGGGFRAGRGGAGRCRTRSGGARDGERGGAAFERLSKYAGERELFTARWRGLWRDDPYYHPGLSLERLRGALS